MPPFSRGVKFPLPDLFADETPVGNTAGQEASPLMEEKFEIEDEEEEEDSELLEQNQVIYREGQTCAGCEYFVAEGEDCERVQGPIASNGWCVIFKGGSQGPELLEGPEKE